MVVMTTGLPRSPAVSPRTSRQPATLPLFVAPVARPGGDGDGP
jgi:hypothetical protein